MNHAPLPPPPSRGSYPSLNGIATNVEHDHESRISKIEGVVGRPPFLDDPGTGIARLAAETHGGVKFTRWAVIVIGAALFGDRGIALARYLWPAPPAAAAAPSKAP